jgi:hypothetical protein
MMRSEKEIILSTLTPSEDDDEKAECGWCYPRLYGDVRRSCLDPLVASANTILVR